jgi:glycyl-tRNA synthetase beta chain
MQGWDASTALKGIVSESARVSVFSGAIEKYAGRKKFLLTDQYAELYGSLVGRPLFEFIVDRLKVQQREAGVRHDLIDAVFTLGGEDDLVRMLARVKALQAFVTTAEGANLLAGYKRAANILKQAQGDYPQPVRVEHSRDRADAAHPLSTSLETNGVEHALESALNMAEPLATDAIEREDFDSAMAALASLRAPIDAFFEGVMVNDPDPDKRAHRLGLLIRFRDAVHRVADFSKIEG